MAWSDVLKNLFNLGPSQEAAPSAQLRSTSIGASRDIPQYTPPAPQPQPKAQPKATGGVPATQPVQSSTPSFSMPSAPEPDYGAIDRSYDPVFQQFNEQVSQLEPRKAEDLSLVEQAEKSGIESVGKQRQISEDQYTAERQDLEQQKGSALSEAVRAYNAMKQAAISRFGGSSSAGQAVGELAQQEYFKQQGNVVETNQREVGALVRQLNSARLFYDEKENEIKQTANAQRMQVSRAYQDAVNQINMSRAMAQAEKAQHKMAAREQWQNQMYQIQQQQANNRLALETWRVQFEAETKGALDKASQDYLIQLQNGIFAEPVAQARSMSIGPSRPANQAIAVNYNPWSRRQNDEDTFFT